MTMEYRDHDFGTMATYTCDGCGESHGMDLLSPADNAVLAQIRHDGKGRMLTSVPPYVVIARLTRLIEDFAKDNGINIGDALRRFDIEAAHGPFGKFSDN